VKFDITPQGYSYVEGDGGLTTIHRLVAVAEYGFDAVAGNDVHHKDGIQSNNSRGNVVPIDKGEHTRKHIEDEYGGRAYRDAAVLRDLYVDRGLSTTEVADRLDCSFQTVIDWLQKHNIDVREQSRWSYHDERNDTDYRDEDTLRDLYIKKDLSTYDLADRFSVSRTTISRWLDRHGIE